MKTRDELYELDRFDLVTEIEKSLGITITEDLCGMPDLALGTWQTADGYEVYVMINGYYMSDMNWESDVYYYEPPLSDVLHRLSELSDGDKVEIYDIDNVFTCEETMIDFLIDNFPEKYVEDEIDIIIKESGE